MHRYTGNSPLDVDVEYSRSRTVVSTSLTESRFLLFSALYVFLNFFSFLCFFMWHRYHQWPTSQRAVMLCGWEVKAVMVRVWVAGKTV